jgi:hypothetical protein
LDGEFEGVCKMEVHLEVLLELHFFTKPPNFGVEAHMEAPTGVALPQIQAAEHWANQQSIRLSPTEEAVPFCIMSWHCASPDLSPTAEAKDEGK